MKELEIFKKKILSLAIEGKLVSQNPKDEPVTILLDKIRQEKEQLIKEKKIKKDSYTGRIYKKDDKYYEKIGSEIKDITEEIPFEIPESWQWVRLGEICYFSIGKTPPRADLKYWNNGIYHWVSISDMVHKGYIETTKEKVSELAHTHIFKNKILPKDSLIFSFKLSIGKISILKIPAYTNEAICNLKPYEYEKELKIYLFSILDALELTKLSKGAIKGQTLNSKTIPIILIPLPPLEEQKRIVKKIEELMELCDKL